MYVFVKRFFDFITALVCLIILSPILIPLVVILRFTGEGYVFYYQRRIGYRNQYFNIIKFATMLKNSPNIGTGVITLKNDPRLLPLGRFLRKSKLNELPQILNVLKGDMSIVGPRPLIDKTFNTYPPENRNKVYQSVPGITGIGSVIFRDEEELISNATISPDEYYKQVIGPYKSSLEVWYNTNKSFCVDIKIIFLTAWVILFPKSQLVFSWFKTLPPRNF